jgi:hypothetical protein
MSQEIRRYMCCGALLLSPSMSLETALYDAFLTLGSVSQFQKLLLQQYLKWQLAILASVQ